LPPAETGGAFAEPILCRWREHPTQRGGAGLGPGIEQVREPEREHGGGFGLEREIGQDILHQGVLAESPPEGCAVARVCRACDTASRIIPVVPSEQSSRVRLTISRIVATPRPSSPIR